MRALAFILAILLSGGILYAKEPKCESIVDRAIRILKALKPGRRIKEFEMLVQPVFSDSYQRKVQIKFSSLKDRMTTQAAITALNKKVKERNPQASDLFLLEVQDETLVVTIEPGRISNSRSESILVDSIFKEILGLKPSDELPELVLRGEKASKESNQAARIVNLKNLQARFLEIYDRSVSEADSQERAIAEYGEFINRLSTWTSGEGLLDSQNFPNLFFVEDSRGQGLEGAARIGWRSKDDSVSFTFAYRVPKPESELAQKEAETGFRQITDIEALFYPGEEANRILGYTITEPMGLAISPKNVERLREALTAGDTQTAKEIVKDSLKSDDALEFDCGLCHDFRAPSARRGNFHGAPDSELKINLPSSLPPLRTTLNPTSNGDLRIVTLMRSADALP